MVNKKLQLRKKRDNSLIDCYLIITDGLFVYVYFMIYSGIEQVFLSFFSHYSGGVL